jgi:hypothetical protein
MEVFYGAAGLDPKDPNTFVALNKQNHKNFPPTCIVTCEADSPRGRWKVMKACLKKAGVPARSDQLRAPIAAGYVLDTWVGLTYITPHTYCHSLLTYFSGTFNYGANSVARYRPTMLSPLAKQFGTPIVLVQTGYRLGPLGFATSEDLALENSQAVSTDYDNNDSLPCPGQETVAS